MSPLFALVVIATAVPNVAGTAFVIVKEFAVILAPRLTLLVPAADEMRTAPRRAVPPSAPERVAAPPVPPFSVRACAPAEVPLTVLEKEMLAPDALAPPFVVSATRLEAKVTGPVIPMAPPPVVIFPFMLMPVVPL